MHLSLERVQGDGGNMSTPGGWLRVFGRSLTLSQAGLSGADAAQQKIRAAEEISAAAQQGDFLRAARLANTYATKMSDSASTSSSTRMPKLLLTDVSTGTNYVPIPAVNASTVDALFLLPSTLPTGTYRVTVSNGYAASALDAFVSPAQPHVSSIDIVRSQSLDFDPTVFAVSDYGCAGGVNSSGAPIDCTKAGE